ncbi:MAG: serine/threonine-protein kinase [Cyanobacteriota bacterium]
METTLAGHYQVVEPLGMGGFGQTFLARDNHLPGNPLCVVKQLKPKNNDSTTLATAKRLFNREAEILYRLGNHDQIPRLLAHFEQDNEFYLVQDYIEGQPLDQELANRKKLSETSVIRLLRDTLEVLAFVHQQNVIHRDIKPANLIRRNTDGKIVLIDFGAVKEVRNQVVNPHGQTSLSVAIGSPGYMPSEQQAFRPQFSSDIYAVGMVCLQALTGLSPKKLPQDTERGEFSCALLSEECDRIPLRYRTSISPGLAAILDKMVRYDYRQRYKNASEALRAVEQLFEQEEPDSEENSTLIAPTQAPLSAISSEPDSQAIPLPFQSLIADKTEGFVGRDYVFEAIESFLQNQACGYFIIEADPGVGKSAILAEYVKRMGCVAHFNVRSQGINRAEEFLKCVCTQLIERYKLTYSLNPEHTRDGNFLARLLNEISSIGANLVNEGATTTLNPKTQSSHKLVIAVDALDEVDLSSQTVGANVLYLPASLPHGVYFIVTKRTTPLPLVVNNQYVFDLMQYAAECLQDAQTYIERRVNQSEVLQAWVENRELTVEEFVTALAQKSDRNFMYLRYVLPAIENGVYQDLNIDNLPEGLEQYYYQHWESMGMTAKPLPRTKIKIVYVLAEARKPVSRQLISEFSGEDALTVQEVLDEWQQFLREHRMDGQTGYSIYHASFQEFLHHQDIVQAAGVTIQGINALIADNLAQELGL